MEINTVILIDENQEKKKKIIEELNSKIVFSYTKLESLISSFVENISKEDNKLLLQFLNTFFKKLSDKEELFLIDVDKLSYENSKMLIQKNPNIFVCYLENVQDGERLKTVNKYEDIEEIMTKAKFGDEINEN